MTLKTVATFHSPFTTKFGIPRQSGVAPAIKGRIVFEPEYRDPDYIRGIGDFDFLWLIWGFSANKHPAAHPTARPPLLGGNQAMGVFATRAPYRPNPIGLSAVRLVGVESTDNLGMVLLTEGADLMDGTPIYDIKPYLAYADCHQEAKGGFTDTHTWHRLQVVIPQQLQLLFSPEQLETLSQVLSMDPRPHYHDDSERIYGMMYEGMDVRFKVCENILTVVQIGK